jgi:hypothetical protein
MKIHSSNPYLFSKLKFIFVLTFYFRPILTRFMRELLTATAHSWVNGFPYKPLYRWHLLVITIKY